MRRFRDWLVDDLARAGLAVLRGVWFVTLCLVGLVGSVFTRRRYKRGPWEMEDEKP